MKKYVLKNNAQSYSLVVDGRNSILVPTRNNYMTLDRQFYGLLVFVKTAKRIVPMVKVVVKTGESFYYKPQDVTLIVDEENSGIIGDYSGRSSEMYDAAYPQYNDASHSDFVGKGIKAGQSFNWGIVRMDKNEHSIKAGKSYNWNTLGSSYSLPEINLADANSSANGDFWKNLFGKNVTKNVEKERLKNELDKKQEFTEQEMKDVHKASNSKQSFGDWLKSDNAASIFNNSIGLAATIINNKNGGGNNNSNTTNLEDEDLPNETGKENNILGMKPLTFGIVTVSTLLVGVVVLIIIKSKKQLKK